MSLGRKSRFYWWIFLASASFIFGVASAAYKLSSVNMLIAFVIFVVFLILVWLVILQVFYKYIDNKAEEMKGMLEDENQIDTYISRTVELFKEMDSEQLKATVAINISKGYCAKSDFISAMNWLRTIKEEKLKGKVRIKFCAYKAFVHFALGEDHFGVNYFNIYQRDMNKLKNDKSINEIISSIEASRNAFISSL
ncbi:MAG: hypothetical protein RR536_02885 [Anaerovoracaceae bacterium]